jgi:hypothetical protein
MSGEGHIWVDITRNKKPRKLPRALRFANIKVGDQLMQKPTGHWYRKLPLYYIVTDIWFDPVAGQNDPIAGTMVAIRQIGEDGEPRARKRGYPIRGLASQQFHYADIDYIAHARARREALNDGRVVGIGFGNVIRKRQKTPGSRL